MDSFDTSIGLSTTLQLLEQYHQNGTLQTEMSNFPGIRGFCRVSIHIVTGKIVSCTLEKRNGQIQSVGISTITRLDEQNGPFEWQFYPQQQQQESTVPSSLPQTQQYLPQSRRAPTYAVPRVVARLNLDWLTTWSPHQKRTLYRVYSLIDGRRTVEDIEMTVAFPARVVQESLVILIAMRVIVITT